MGKAYTYHNESELISSLKKLNDEKEDLCIDEIILLSVGNSTFRAFRGMKKKPSGVYREWASNKLREASFIKNMIEINNQAEFDKWHNELCNSFANSWKRKMGNKIGFGPSRKLPNLLLKTITRFYERIPKDKREKIKGYLHVPLDSYVLIAIKVVMKDSLKNLKGFTMKSIDNPEKYNKIQGGLRGLAKKAGVSPICLDYLAWNKRALGV